MKKNNLTQELQKTMVPTIMVLFGVTGDLAKRKVLPALFDLYLQKHLPKDFALIGFSRRPLAKKKNEDNDDGIRRYVRSIIAKKGHRYKKKDIDQFLQMIHYQAGDFTKVEDLGDLAEHLVRIEDRFGRCTNKLFHLAVPPKYYKQLFKNLAQTGLTLPCSDTTGWARVLVEKPFGSDIKSAISLDTLLSSLFKEEQIFRIDHYLGKEMVQDILMFRFANTIFEPLWNKDYIERVELTINEDIDVQERGAFYDGIGALRDVGANHALQMFSLVAMERPVQFDSHAIREARARAVSHILPISKKQIPKQTFRAQYVGYHDTKRVFLGSDTETYFHVTLFSNDVRWTGVPFVIQGGKALDKKQTEIRIIFKKGTSLLDTSEYQNELRFCIQPCQEIRMRFATKVPGFTYNVKQEDFVFSQMSKESGVHPDAYEKVLFDCIRGDQTMFASSEEVVNAWKVITPIVKAWKKDYTPLVKYKKGERAEQVRKDN